MSEKFIFCFVDKDENGIFKDLTADVAQSKIEYWPSHKFAKGKINQFIKSVLLSMTLNSKFHVPFQEVYYNLHHYPFKKEDDYYVILPSTSISQYSLCYLKKFKQKNSNVHLIALLTDSMHASSPHLNLVRDKLFSDVWYKVLTYDKYDAKEYGFTWFGYTYYSDFTHIKPSNKISDIYYIGFEKGHREGKIADIYEYLKQNDVDACFKVIHKKGDEFVKGSSLAYTQNKIPYPQVISEIQSTNCILEMLQENQESQSLRYFESIVFNKKLLSNNKHLSELPYYNEKYMKYFDKIEDIDPNWVKEKTNIDYGYKGEFSPIYLIDFIQSLIEKE